MKSAFFEKLFLLFFIACLLPLADSFSQSVSAVYSYGNALGKTNMLRKNMQYGDIRLGYGTDIGSDFEANIALGISFVGYSRMVDGRNAYDGLMFVRIPVSLRRYIPVNHAETIVPFIELGGFADWCVYKRSELYLPSGMQASQYKSPGINFGISTVLGVRFYLNQKSSIDIFVSGLYDVANHYEKAQDEISFSKQVLSVSYNVRLEKKRGNIDEKK